MTPPPPPKKNRFFKINENIHKKEDGHTTSFRLINPH